MGMIFWAMFGRETPFDRDDYYKEKVLGGERPFVDPSWHAGFVEVGSVFRLEQTDTREGLHHGILRSLFASSTVACCFGLLAG